MNYAQIKDTINKMSDNKYTNDKANNQIHERLFFARFLV